MDQKKLKLKKKKKEGEEEEEVTPSAVVSLSIVKWSIWCNTGVGGGEEERVTEMKSPSPEPLPDFKVLSISFPHSIHLLLFLYHLSLISYHC